jgi:hypothetical protein
MGFVEGGERVHVRHACPAEPGQAWHTSTQIVRGWAPWLRCGGFRSVERTATEVELLVGTGEGLSLAAAAGSRGWAG